MMNSISKIALAAILGLTANAKALGEGDAKFRALSDHAGRALKGNKGHKKAGFFDEGDSYFLGHCRVNDADGAKKGSI